MLEFKKKDIGTLELDLNNLFLTSLIFGTFT
jgi:hypothetical protein